MSDAEESDSEKADAAEDGFATLRAAGIDPDIGLLYCQKDENFYRSLLAEYASENAEKTESIRTSFAGENWHDYAIYVHALKSTSKMIGASTLSEMAAGLEAAANAGDAATIKRGHDVMMAEYEAVAGAIRSVVPERGTSSIEDDIMEFTPGEDDVIEFLPHE